MVRKLKQEKRGWIRIVEAFTAVLLIAGVLLIVVDKGYLQTNDHSKEIYEAEKSILKEIQLNDNLRDSVLNAPGTLPLNHTNLPNDIKNKINEMPNHLVCRGAICDIDSDCLYTENIEKDLYARNVIISSTQSQYNPRQLKMFCYMKE
jgi:negative regulator of sigma E activity